MMLGCREVLTCVSRPQTGKGGVPLSGLVAASMGEDSPRGVGPGSSLTQPLPQVHHINANYFLDITALKPEDLENNVFGFSSTFEDPSTTTYLRFLREGLQRGLPLLQP